MQSTEWPTIIRHVHLKGGLRALNKPGKDVLVFPTAQPNTAASFEIPFYGHLLSHLLQEKLGPFGIEYFETNEQIEGVFPSTWKISSQQEYEQEVSIEELWSDIARRALEDDRNELAEVAGRFSFGFIASKRRLKDLSDAYHNELRSLLYREQYEPLHCFVPSDTSSLLLAAHTLFEELSQIAGSVTRYISTFVYPGELVIGSSPSEQLRETLRSRVGENDAFTDDLWHATEPGSRTSNSEQGVPEGWLARIDRYSRTLSQLLSVSRTTPLYLMMSGEMGMLGDNVLPGVNCFLPESSTEVQHARRTGWLTDPKNGPTFTTRADALGVAFEGLSRMIELSFKLIGFSPTQTETRQAV